MNKKKILVILAFIILVVVGMLFITRQRQQRASLPTITPTSAPENFEVTNIFPTGETQIIIPDIAIGYEFSSPVDETSVRVEIDPQIDLTTFTENKNRTLYLKPTSEWTANTTYSITLEVTSLTGKKLTSPINHTFTPIIPTKVDFPD